MIIWHVDTDFLFLEESFVLLNIFGLYPSADNLMGKDAFYFASSGLILPCNTIWALHFFEAWWTKRGTLGVQCDQHVLNHFS